MAGLDAREVAIAAIRVKRTYLQAQHQRLRPRRGHKKALGAVKHTITCAVWHMLTTGEIYRELGADYFTRRDPERRPSDSSINSNSSGTPSSSPRRRHPRAKFSCQPKASAREGRGRPAFAARGSRQICGPSPGIMDIRRRPQDPPLTPKVRG
jgi:hypothetical protein